MAGLRKFTAGFSASRKQAENKNKMPRYRREYRAMRL